MRSLFFFCLIFIIFFAFSTPVFAGNVLVPYGCVQRERIVSNSGSESFRETSCDEKSLTCDPTASMSCQPICIGENILMRWGVCSGGVVLYKCESKLTGECSTVTFRENIGVFSVCVAGTVERGDCPSASPEVIENTQTESSGGQPSGIDLRAEARSLNPMNFGDVSELIGRVINALMAFIGSITLVLYIFAGFLWMTAAGAKEKIVKAKSIFIWTSMGVIVMLGSYILVKFVFDILG
ncbi:MAG: pilin [Patescibacteria group bacterium]